MRCLACLVRVGRQSLRFRIHVWSKLNSNLREVGYGVKNCDRLSGRLEIG